jgi:copper chaperone CopZ
VGSATVDYDPQATSAERIARAIEDEGYGVETAGR